MSSLSPRGDRTRRLRCRSAQRRVHMARSTTRCRRTFEDALVLVGWGLGQPHPAGLACFAEQITRYRNRGSNTGSGTRLDQARRVHQRRRHQGGPDLHPAGGVLKSGTGRGRSGGSGSMRSPTGVLVVLATASSCFSVGWASPRVHAARRGTRRFKSSALFPERLLAQSRSEGSIWTRTVIAPVFPTSRRGPSDLAPTTRRVRRIVAALAVGPSPKLSEAVIGPKSETGLSLDLAGWFVCFHWGHRLLRWSRRDSTAGWPIRCQASPGSSG